MPSVNPHSRGNVRSRTKSRKRPETSAGATAKPDRRITRTRDSLHVAMMRLVLEKGFGHTTAAEVAERANVGRSTLYAHHGGKEGALLSGLHHLREKLRAAQAASGGERLAFSDLFFEHMAEYRDVHRALARHGGHDVVMTALRKMLRDLVAAELPPGALPRTAVVGFVVDAFESVLRWSLDQTPAPSAQTVDAIFRRLTLGALTGAGQA